MISVLESVNLLFQFTTRLKEPVSGVQTLFCVTVLQHLFYHVFIYRVDIIAKKLCTHFEVVRKSSEAFAFPGSYTA